MALEKKAARAGEKGSLQTTCIYLLTQVLASSALPGHGFDLSESYLPLRLFS